MERDLKIEQWFRLYAHDVHNYLVYFLDKGDVEDLVQEVFVNAIKGLPHFKGRASPKTWLFSIARRIALNYIRKERMLNMLPFRLRGELETEEKTPEEGLAMKEDVEIILSVLQTLKSNYREVLILRVIEDLSVTETAEVLGWSENRVSVTFHRALRSLRYKLIELEGGNGEWVQMRNT